MVSVNFKGRVRNMDFSDNILLRAGRTKTKRTRLRLKEAVKDSIFMPLMKSMVVLTFLMASFSCMTTERMEELKSGLMDIKIDKAIQEGRIHIGSTLDEVCNVVGFRPDPTPNKNGDSNGDISTRADSSGRWMTWTPYPHYYSTILAAGLMAETKHRIWQYSYTFIFLNDRLASWSRDLP
jgi:hypothetical protein